MLRLVLLFALMIGAAGCGVKSDLDPPPGATQQQKGEPDPSKPPKPIGG